MHIELTGKTALVSGSTAGIGFAIARGLAGTGATVVVNGRTQAAVDAAIERIRATQPEARLRGHAGDLGSAAGCDALFARRPDGRHPRQQPRHLRGCRTSTISPTASGRASSRST